MTAEICYTLRTRVLPDTGAGNGTIGEVPLNGRFSPQSWLDLVIRPEQARLSPRVSCHVFSQRADHQMSAVSPIILTHHFLRRRRSLTIAWSDSMLDEAETGTSSV